MFAYIYHICCESCVKLHPGGTMHKQSGNGYSLQSGTLYSPDWNLDPSKAKIGRVVWISSFWQFSLWISSSVVLFLVRFSFVEWHCSPIRTVGTSLSKRHVSNGSKSECMICYVLSEFTFICSKPFRKFPSPVIHLI